MTNSMMLNAQWATRPNDQRFLTLEDLHTATLARKDASFTQQVRLADMRALPLEDNRLALSWNNYGEIAQAEPTHWSFNQIANVTGSPAAWMRRIPSALAAINLQYGLENLSSREDGLLLVDERDMGIRALTSTTYGRVWDHELVEAVMAVNEAHGGRWKIPTASYATQNPKRATTLYASDRDVWMFLVDDQHPIEVDGETLFRGFAASNSEVGGGTVYLTTFLYRYICDNRIIWGMTDQKEINIKHTRNAPERFRSEVGPALLAYSNASDSGVVQMIRAAKNEVISAQSDTEEVSNWLRARGFTAAMAKSVQTAARAEEGEVRTVWDIVQGVTAHARSIEHQDERIELELRATKLLSALN
jgi:hypothetical protein